jgi:hypothetical protein
MVVASSKNTVKSNMSRVNANIFQPANPKLVTKDTQKSVRDILWKNIASLEQTVHICI